MDGVANRIVALAHEMGPMVEEYARDLNERHYLVHAALVRTLRGDPNLDNHPVLSGDVWRELAAVLRAQGQAPRAGLGAPARGMRDGDAAKVPPRFASPPRQPWPLR